MRPSLAGCGTPIRGNTPRRNCRAGHVDAAIVDDKCQAQIAAKAACRPAINLIYIKWFGSEIVDNWHGRAQNDEGRKP